MASSLLSLDFARFEAANRALLAPLASPCADAWREDVMRALCDLFEASGATFYLPDQERIVQGYGRALPLEKQIGAYTEATWAGTGRSRDPILDEFHDALLRTGTAVWSMASADHDLLGGTGRAWRSVFYNEVLADAEAGDTHAVFVPTPQGSVMVSVHGFRRPPVDDEYFPVLRTLHPALIAGLDAYHRLGAHRAAFDAVAEPLAVFDSGGRETHRNPALVCLFAPDPEASHAEAALAAFARRVRPVGFRRRGEEPPTSPASAGVRTVRARYAFRAALLPAGGLGFGDAFLVTVSAEGGAAAFPSREEVRARHGLTEREAEVALLVGKGLSNDAVAERLFVSRHTVRHHLEGAMAKLGVTGRGREAVAARLLGDEVGAVA